MKIIIILTLLTILWFIVSLKGEKRTVLFLIGIFFLNNRITIQPFDSYTLLCCAYFCSLLYHGELKREWNSFPFKKIMIILLAIHFLVVILDNRHFTVLQVMSRFCNNYIPRYLALFIGYALINKSIDFRKLSTKITTIFVIMGLYGLLSFIIQSNPYDDLLNVAFDKENIWTEVQIRGYRVYSTLNNPIVYGFVMGIALLFTIQYNERISRKYKFVVYLLLMLNIFFANSRTSVIASGILFLSHFITKDRFSVKKVRYGLTFLLILCLSYYTIPAVNSSISNVYDIFITGGENTSGSNMELKYNQWDTSLLLFYIHPYFGNGFHYFQEVIEKQNSVLLDGLAGLEGFGYKLLVEEGAFMTVAVAVLFFNLIIFFFKRRKIQKFYSFGVSLIFSFLFFIMATGTYGGIFTICMIIIGLNVKAVQRYEILYFDTSLQR